MNSVRASAVGLVLLTGIGVTAIGSLLVHWAREHCYGHGDHWVLGIGLIIFLSGVSGSFFLWKNYTRCYIAHIVVNVFLFVALFAVLVMFWSVVGANHGRAEQLWRHTIIDDEGRWDGVVRCFRDHDLCGHRPHFHDCCQRPADCDPSLASPGIDCARWRKSNSTKCYWCETCRRATFFRQRAYGQRVNPGLIMFFIVLALAVVLQIYIE